MIEKDKIGKYLRDFRQKGQKAYNNYQIVGDARNRNAYEKYDDLEEICRMALKTHDDDMAAAHRRAAAVDKILDELEAKPQYSRQEVEDLLRKVRLLV